MHIGKLRKKYHKIICNDIVREYYNKNKKRRYYNFADSDNTSSVAIAYGIIELIGFPVGKGRISGQTAGNRFEIHTKEFIQNVFEQLQHLRPGEWDYITEKERTKIINFDQYTHLAYVAKVVKKDKNLRSTLGGDYIVEPDIVITRNPVPDHEINKKAKVLDPNNYCSTATPLRKANLLKITPILHASISCKWTIRSDRAQNTRTEALNLIRNRKGKLPHVVAVSAEPLPTRLAALALGTGDLDCVYHFALRELIVTLKNLNNEDQMDMLEMLTEGRRLRDISDLPFDLAI